MDNFLMSSKREESYNGTFSNNSKHNSQRQKDILLSNDASGKNFEICSTSKFDAQMLQHEIQNIQHKVQQQENININSSSIDCKIQRDLQFELNDYTDKEDYNNNNNTSSLNAYEDALGFKNTHIYDFNQQIGMSSSNFRRDEKQNGLDEDDNDNDSSAFLHQSFSLQLQNIAMKSSNTLTNSQPQIFKKAQQMHQLEMIKGNFSLVQNQDVTQDEMLLDRNRCDDQVEAGDDDTEGLDGQDTSLQYTNKLREKELNKFNNLKMQSEQNIHQHKVKGNNEQSQQLNMHRLSDSSHLLPSNHHHQYNNKVKQIPIKQSSNFMLIQPKNNVPPRKNNYLTSEESNPIIPNGDYSQQLRQQLKQANTQDGNYSNQYPNQYRKGMNVESENEENQNNQGDAEEERQDEFTSQTSGQNVQFVTLQNDLGDSMQKKAQFNSYFNMNNSLAATNHNGQREDFLFNNQSAHFSTMNPSYLENCQQQYQSQQNQNINNTNNANNSNNIQVGQDKQKIKRGADRQVIQEQVFETSSSPYTPNRLYNIQQTSEQSNVSTARVDQYGDSHSQTHQERQAFPGNYTNQQHQLYSQNNFNPELKNQNNNKIPLKNKNAINSSQSYQTTLENENNYRTIDINEQKKVTKTTTNANSMNQADQEIMQKLYKNNQELAQQNKKISQENQMLKLELETMKTDLLKKYEDIRKNNESLFKSFEDQSNLMLKKQKEKYEDKMLQLQLQLRDSESQNLFKKDNFRDRNNQLYGMVLKLEKEKQELHDKNLQLIKKQINMKSESHKNVLGSCGMINNNNNITGDQIDVMDIDKSHISQSSIPYRKLKMSNADDSSLQIDKFNQNEQMNNQMQFCQGIITSPNSFSSRMNNQKSKSIDIVRKNAQWSSSAQNIQDNYNQQQKNVNQQIIANQQTNLNQSEIQFKDFKIQAEKMILEKKYDDLFSKYRKVLDENHELRRNKVTINEKSVDIERSIDQSQIISPAITTAEARLSHYLSQQTNNHSNNNSTQMSSNYYQPPINSKELNVKTYHQRGSSSIQSNDNNYDYNVHTNILNRDRTPIYYPNKKTIRVQDYHNNNNNKNNSSKIYDLLNSTVQDEKEDTVNQTKPDSTNILHYHHYKTQESNDSPSKGKRSIHFNYINPKYFSNETDKENNMNMNNKMVNLEELSDQNPCSLVRMNNYVLSRKYADKEELDNKQKKKSLSKQKEQKKKRNNKNSLDISMIRDKIKGGGGGHHDDNKENNFNNDYIKNIIQQDKTKKVRSNSVSKNNQKTPGASTVTTINYDKDTSHGEINKKKGNSGSVNTSKNEIKRLHSNTRGSKTPINLKSKI